MSSTPDNARTRFCVLTAEGRGAVAVVRVWGADAVRVVDAVFRPHRKGALATSGEGRLRIGRVGSGLGDEVVSVVVEGPTPEVEIHCHGGPAPLVLVTEALEQAGAERRQPVAWVRAASRSAVAAEAEVDLARAATVRAAEVLLEQAQGALEAEAQSLIETIARDPRDARTGLHRLIARADVGLRLVSGWRVALAGRPNVGKSRLLNALAGYDRAIVDPTPGTTRDIVAVRIALEGWPVELSDTAGLRVSDDDIEAGGIARARSAHESADLVIVVTDRSEPLTDDDFRLLAPAARRLVVANKSDLPAAWDPSSTGSVSVSAIRGDGIDALGTAIARRLVPEAPPERAGVPFRPRQVRHIKNALKALHADDPAGATNSLRMLLAALPRAASENPIATEAELDGDVHEPGAEGLRESPG